MTVTIDYKENLLPYQVDGVEPMLGFLARYGSCKNMDEMGLGKSLQAIACMKALQPSRIVVFCPPTLRYNWLNEILKWTKLLDNKIQVLGKQKDIIDSTKRVIIVPYSLVNNKHIYTQLAKLVVKFSVLDESHKLKNRQAQVTKNTMRLLTYYRTRHNAVSVFLSGTPIKSYTKDLYPFLRFMYNSGYKCPFFADYRTFATRYCDAKKVKNWWVDDGTSNEEELNAHLKNFTIRRFKKNVAHQLPDKVRRIINIDIDKKKALDYADSTGQWNITHLNLEKLKFQQHFMSARSLLGELKVTESLKHIEDILEQKQKIVVFCWHKKVLELLQEGLSDYKMVVVSGGTEAKKRQDAVDEFQKDDSVRVFLGNIAAAGTGITLTAADHVVFVEFDWSPAENAQAEDRIHRISQTKISNIDYLVANHPLDMKVWNIISEKAENIRKVIDE